MGEGRAEDHQGRIVYVNRSESGVVPPLRHTSQLSLFVLSSQLFIYNFQHTQRNLTVNTVSDIEMQKKFAKASKNSFKQNNQITHTSQFLFLSRNVSVESCS